MTTLSLLGKSLKDGEVIELPEHFDVDVVYDFDRLHENTPDAYWAAIKAAGIQLRFDERQTLRTVFCYIRPHEGFDPAAPEEIGVPVFETFELAEKACQDAAIKYQTSRAPGLWLKLHGPGYDAHYEFKDGRVFKVALMLP